VFSVQAFSALTEIHFAFESVKATCDRRDDLENNHGMQQRLWGLGDEALGNHGRV
jgi:hypothetical protein